MNLMEAIGGSHCILEELMAGLNQAVVLAEADGRITFASQAAEKVLGYHPEEIVGRDLSILFTPEDMAYMYPNLFYLAGREQPFEGEVMLLRKNRTPFFAFMTFRSCRDRENGKNLIAVLIHSIDHQKRLEKLMRETHFEDLVKIANGIAHELRNPLVGIGGFVNRIHRTCEAEEQYFRYILLNLRKIETLVEKIQFLVSLPKPQFTEQSVQSLVETACESHAERAREKQVRFVSELEDRSIMIDRELCIRALSILVENALDFMKSGGEIRFAGQAADGMFRLEVADNGAGISPDDLPFIFNPFFSTKADGIGIDLAVARRVMETHAGRLEASSTVGAGTTFFLSFPLERRRAIRTRRLED